MHDMCGVSLLDRILSRRRAAERGGHDPVGLTARTVSTPWLHRLPCELEDRLYRSRDVFASALTEYDEVCARHDAEMDGIRDALLAKFGAVPFLETYRQMMIRQQKIKDWTRAIWWAQRGLALYADHAACPEVVDDLHKRLAAYQAKLATGSSRPPNLAPVRRSALSNNVIEVLVCAACGASFERAVVSGRKPKNCPGCR